MPTEVSGPENERDRRIRLREQERMRRNQGLGDEGLNYGSNQGVPVQPIKPQQTDNLYGERANSTKRDEMLARKAQERLNSRERPA